MSARRWVLGGVMTVMVPQVCAGVDVACYPDLPAPQVAIIGKETEQSSVRGKRFTTYHFDVTNWKSFPDELFDLSPELPPCGENPDSSRTWLQIYADGGKFIYSFCVLSGGSSNGGWFAFEEGSPQPDAVVIVLTDRACHNRYVSNAVALANVRTVTRQEVMSLEQATDEDKAWLERRREKLKAQLAQTQEETDASNPRLMKLLLNLVTLLEYDRPEEAEPLYYQMIHIAEARNDRERLVMAYGRLAWLLERRGDYAGAHALIEKQLPLVKDGKSKHSVQERLERLQRASSVK